jgi:inosose dehydratase
MNIVDVLDECPKMLTDIGIVPALRQHTGTCFESRDELDSVPDYVDSRYAKFGPDTGQLQKGGVDPVNILVPVPAGETAKTAKTYLRKPGCVFRS